MSCSPPSASVAPASQGWEEWEAATFSSPASIRVTPSPRTPRPASPSGTSTREPPARANAMSSFIDGRRHVALAMGQALYEEHDSPPPSPAVGGQEVSNEDQ